VKPRIYIKRKERSVKGTTVYIQPKPFSHNAISKNMDNGFIWVKRKIAARDPLKPPASEDGLD
jgi:hypothetical protein